MYGGELESETWTETLLNMTGSVVTQSCSGVGFVMTDVQSCSGSIEEVSQIKDIERKSEMPF